MTIIPTYFNYFHICRRKRWLFVSGITMEHTSDLVTEGKLIGESHTPSKRATKILNHL